jgi:hypothetical protein
MEAGKYKKKCSTMTKIRTEMKVFLWLADFLFFLRKIFGNEMFLAWSKQLENEGMGTRIGVSSWKEAMQKINCTFKTVIRRFIHTYDNTCVTTSVVDVTIYFPLPTPLIRWFPLFLRKIFGNKMFLAWSKQLENEGMGSRIGVSSFFISQSSIMVEYPWKLANTNKNVAPWQK